MVQFLGCMASLPESQSTQRSSRGGYAPIRGNTRDGRKEGEWLIHRADGLQVERIVYDRGRIVERVALLDTE